ncbi:hypothetical protein LCGC14_0417850 [marine sediment metagenome]|uniref:Uncharacterized protein n=1 Tax=marine sediment metagenome TaxID=412755 RepID=A0A0F9SXP7_9ZZZZ
MSVLTMLSNQLTMSEERTIEYKRVKILKEHCPVCEEEARGNGSGILPYQCSCGVWEYVSPGKFKIVEESINEDE